MDGQTDRQTDRLTGLKLLSSSIIVCSLSQKSGAKHSGSIAIKDWPYTVRKCTAYYDCLSLVHDSVLMRFRQTAVHRFTHTHTHRQTRTHILGSTPLPTPYQVGFAVWVGPAPDVVCKGSSSQHTTQHLHHCSKPVAFVARRLLHPS